MKHEPDWKLIALTLADWHAANAEYDARLASTSKARRTRMIGLCDTAAKYIRGHETAKQHRHGCYEQAVLDRLDGCVEYGRVATGESK